MKRGNKRRAQTPPRLRGDSRYYRILEEISTGDLFWGFLTSAGSTRLMYKNAYASARERYENRLALERLEACGYVRREKKGGKPVFFATNQGRAALKHLYRGAAEVRRRNERWDGYWRVVSYDFPESERAHRDALRYVLKQTDFLQIQKSVWIFPYDIPALAQLLAANAVVDAHTLHMKATGTSLDEKYKGHFRIK